jgi:DNA (cytosine-5)-methyltransferase 1
MLNGLDLFSGVGGLALALSEWVRPVAYCENDRYAQAVLLSRMQRGGIARAPIWDDVRTFPHPGFAIDIIYGGFPCQDISCAGNGIGLGGERSGLFFEIVRLTKEINPSFVFLENVPAIRTRGLREVVRAFADLRYDCRWTCVSAAEVGAPHLRKRWFMLAHPNGKRLEGLERKIFSKKRQSSNTTMALGKSWLSSDSGFVRKNNELPRPMDRIKCLGNAVVPLQAKTAFERLMGLR